jgi:hypothetical protein
MMILNRLIDRVGDLNPQLFRELKERLTLRNIGIVFAAALLVQGFVLIYFNGQIPVPSYKISSINGSSTRTLVQVYSKYCVPITPTGSGDQCILAGDDSFKINWQLWWSNIFICLNWIISGSLILGSVYTLVADLLQEEKRGTLNFIRLSPQSAPQIFVGKILGVPILVYLGVALILPLHLSIRLNIAASLPFLASWYLMITAIWFLLASAAILYVLLGGIQAILTTAAVAWPMFFASQILNEVTLQTIQGQGGGYWGYIETRWFGLMIASSAIRLHLFVAVSCLVVSFGVWQAIKRRYLNPMATAISKPQSYLANLCLQIWIAGFALSAFDRDIYATERSIAGFASIDLIALLVLIPMLLPSKQSIQDWSRYRRERVAGQPLKFWQRGLVKDLIVNDHSPTLLAIAINLGIAMVLWIPLSIAFRTPGYGLKFLAGICLAASLTLIYVAIAHLVLFFKIKKRNLWIFGVIGSAMLLPLGAAMVLSPVGNPTGFAALLLLFSPFAPIGILSLSGGTILATFITQLAMFGILTRQLQRQLKISGQSQTKELFARS